MLEEFGSQSGYDKTFVHVPTISSTTTNARKYYVPGDLETTNELIDFFHNISPALNGTDLDLLDELYPHPPPTRIRRLPTH